VLRGRPLFGLNELALLVDPALYVVESTDVVYGGAALLSVAS